MEAKKPLKYLGYAIVCEEVPDEISIAFNISGCEHKCKDCHSKYLWEYEGEYVLNDLDNVINIYKDLVTCVCFLGGDQNIDELYHLCLDVKKHGLKTCIYSGCNSTDYFYYLINDNLIDYLKIGEYISTFGPINKPTTNQKMYKITNGNLEDITYKFWKSEIN